MLITDKIKALLSKETANQLPLLIEKANQNQSSYEDFINGVVDFEWSRREENRNKRKFKNANMPYSKKLDDFDVTRITGITENQLKQLAKLKWVDNHFNLILLGTPGLGKSHIALGLATIAINQGKKAIFITTRELMIVLKTEEVIKRSEKMLEKIKKADLLIIDDLVTIAKTEDELNLFFDLITILYEQTSIIITSNNQPKEWNKKVKEQKPLIAILDKLTHRAQIIQLEGESYRMENRETIF